MQEMMGDRLERLFSECDKHVLRMNSAKAKLAAVLPLTSIGYSALTEDEIEHIDQFLFRFAKLQDAIGQRLFKSILLFLQEDVEGVPFVDILSKLEKLHLIESSTQWQMLREVRNEIAHQYDDAPELAAQALNTIFDSKVLLESIYLGLKEAYLNRK
ncbi:hypothetical protein [Marinomonas shanghaiensis]|uniref:hypothetical protein n=1 Tax=Marinomonas shanghaiensis TaxID=2202418 RepID=UPI003A8E4F35